MFKDVTTPNILIDTSYIIYNFGFSLWRWYINESDDFIPIDGTFDPITDPEFKYKFDKEFFYRIHQQIIKLYPFYNKSKIIFCNDCARKDIWRKEHYPEYKLNRENKEHKFSWDGIRNRIYNILIPNLIEEYKCKQLQIYGAEADDIIATLVKFLKKQNNDIENLVISSDKDIWQLLDYCRIINMQGIEAELDISTKRYKIEKILQGDKGDNINSIYPRIGPKTAQKLVDNKNLLFEKLKDQKIAEKFKLNRLLIDLDLIPKYLQKEILIQYVKCTKK